MTEKTEYTDEEMEKIEREREATPEERKEFDEMIAFTYSHKKPSARVRKKDFGDFDEYIAKCRAERKERRRKRE